MLQSQIIETYLSKKRGKFRFTEEQLILAEEDLKLGAGSEVTDLYLVEGFDTQKMRVISEAAKKDTASEVFAILVKQELNGAQTKVFYDAIKAGVALHTAIAYADGKHSAFEMSKVYDRLQKETFRFEKEVTEESENLEYVTLLVESIKELVTEVKADRDKMAKALEVTNEAKVVDYETAITSAKGMVRTSIVQEHKSNRTSRIAMFFASKLGFKLKSRQDLIKLIAEKELIPAQLEQIKMAIQKGLKEKQLLELINHKVSAEQMKEIIEIAVLQNNMLG